MNRRKYILLSAALLLMLIANLNIGWHISLDGTDIEGRWSSAAIRRANVTARLAAEELLHGKAMLPRIEKRLSLGFGTTIDSPKELSHALLMGTPGITLRDFVLVNGVSPGCVEDGQTLMTELKRFIANRMPNAASYGSYSGEIDIDPRYTRSGRETPMEDMVLLVSGMAPVFYTDSQGNRA